MKWSVEFLSILRNEQMFCPFHDIKNVGCTIKFNQYINFSIHNSVFMEAIFIINKTVQWCQSGIR